ncbi:pyridoxamine 5'-phosphate oxidase family protein [Halobaculum lipolyticum]|uniref:Pyridoxamine 5'-phosphate oxidase family protein n=1 Tax=Halobaculum lipolyticum TaxID=3032001 RepID=A0ABD5W9M9_9EURY|nr:pyridoxamine 5'-phosphate oxidase family protein [Halobaculum sp. DT31]
MDTPDAVTMSDAERDEFLGDGGVGVLSFATDADESGAPHSVPVSYGYDGVENAFYFRLAVGADSEKPPLPDRPVTFVTYDDVDDVWHSVVAAGRLVPTDDDAVATAALEGLSRVGIPLVDAFGRPTAEVQFEFYRLDPDSLTGRREASVEV